MPRLSKLVDNGLDLFLRISINGGSTYRGASGDGSLGGGGRHAHGHAHTHTPRHRLIGRTKKQLLNFPRTRPTMTIPCPCSHHTHTPCRASPVWGAHASPPKRQFFKGQGAAFTRPNALKLGGLALKAGWGVPRMEPGISGNPGDLSTARGVP